MKHQVYLAVAALAIVSGCKEKEPTAPALQLAQFVPVGKVQVMIQQDTRVSGDSAVFVVSVVGAGLPMASYQGTVTFNSAALTVAEAVMPTAAPGEFRIVNATNSANGTIRFAGFATESFSNIEVFRLVGHFKPGKLPLNMVGSLDVAGEVSGSAIKMSSLRSSDAVRDLYSNIVVVP